MWVHCNCDFISHHALPQPSTARIGWFPVRAARLPARLRSGELFAPETSRLMRPFDPVSLRPGQAALCASVASHGRKPFSPQTVFTGSRLSAPTNPGDITASPGFWWSHNSSSKPTPCRGVGRVLYATLHASAAPPRVGLTQALGGRKAFDCLASQCSFPGFGWRCSSVVFMRRCSFGQVCQARSHIACVTLASFGHRDRSRAVFRD